MRYQFEELRVWQQGMAFVTEVYAVTKRFPRDEQFGLTSQLRRAAVSVPVNIAEGRGRHSKREYLQFLYTARGSLFELLTLLQVARQLHYLSAEELSRLDRQARDLTGMLNGLINSIRP